MDIDESVQRDLNSVMDVALELALRVGLDEAHVRKLVDDSLARVRVGENRLAEDLEVTAEQEVLLGGMLGWWHRAPAYVDELGDPIAIPRDGSGPSLRALYGAARDSSPRKTRLMGADEAIDFLIRHGGIEETAEGLFLPTGMVLRVNTGTSVGIKSQLSYFAEFGETVAYNLTKPGGTGRFMVTSHVDGFPVRDVPRIHSMLWEHGVEFIRQVDDDLVNTVHAALNGAGEKKRIGVGMYLFERDLDEKGS